MSDQEKFTPRQAGEEAAKHYRDHILAVTALDKAHATIETSARNAQNTELDERRRALAEWHIEWWTERSLPEAVKHLDTVNQKAERNFKTNQELYHQAALAEALLDGVEISVS